MADVSNSDYHQAATINMNTKTEDSFDELSLPRRRLPSCFEVFMYLISVFVTILGLPICLAKRIRRVYHYERAVILRFGRVKQNGASLITGPGIYYLMPFIDKMLKTDTRMELFCVRVPPLTSKDGISVEFSVYLRIRVVQPSVVLLKVNDCKEAVGLLLKTSLAEIIGDYTLHDILASRDLLSHRLDTQMKLSEVWGIMVDGVQIKEVTVSEEVRRTFGAETLANMSSRAKQINAKTEHETTMLLQEAAKALQSCPAALQLRYLQSLGKMSDNGNSTVLFPLPLEMLSLFKSKKDKGA